MDKDNEVKADHLPLEEVLLSEIDGMQPPEQWNSSEDEDYHELPPVLIEEGRGYSLVGNHRTVWHLRARGRSLVKCLVVRSTVHVKPAHSLISNCTEEAMLFEALLRREIVVNRSRLADMLGYSRARITQLLNLLKLPDDIRQKVLVTDEVSEFQLRQLLKVVDDRQKLHSGFQKLLEKKLSGRQMAMLAGGKGESREPVKEDAPEQAAPEDEPEDEIPSDSMTELEEVFAEEKGVEPEEKPPVDAEPQRVKREPDMRQILEEVGSLRDGTWRGRAAGYGLAPLHMDFLEGVALLRTGLYQRAMDLLTEVVSEDPSHHAAWFYLGRCSNLTGALNDAEEYLRNALARKPEDPDYIVELAIVLEKLKRHNEAEAFYRKSAAIRKKRASEK